MRKEKSFSQTQAYETISKMNGDISVAINATRSALIIADRCGLVNTSTTLVFIINQLIDLQGKIK